MGKRWLIVVALAAVFAPALVQAAKPPAPASPKTAELERKIAEEKARIEAAQATLAALERELADAQAGALDEVIRSARTGDEAAIRTILELAGTDVKWVAYDYAKIVKGMDAKPFLRVLEPVWPTAGPVPKAKFCWMLGVNGSADAAARLRVVLEKEDDPSVLANAIHALSRCPDAPENVAAVQRHVADQRHIGVNFGFYPHGIYKLQPLALTAREYVARRDAALFATVPRELVVEPATIHCAGFQWSIAGDANRNCTVAVAYRKAGTEAWKQGFPFLRCESWDVPNEKYTFNVGEKLAGSIFDLEEDTEYEVQLSLHDPDGGAAERIVKTHTIKEPPLYAGLRTLYVVPGTGGGSGTKEDPFQGLVAANAAAQPGDVMLLQAGTYLGSVPLNKSGAEGKPIVWRGVDVDKVVLDGSGKDECLSFSMQSFLQFENLSFVGAKQGCIKTYGAQDIVVRRCKFFKFGGIGIIAQSAGPKTDRKTGQVTPGRNCKNWFVLDNEIQARKNWAKERGSAMLTGVNLAGARNIIAYNKISDCWDNISLAGARPGILPLSCSTDVYGNDLYQGADDGIEADYTFHNVRVFRNRLTNTFSSLSAQPTYGGPTYFLYNAMYNTTNKPLKLHVNSTGIIAAHNTAAVSREAFYGGSFHNALFRNNLLLGLAGAHGYWMSTDGFPLDMDYGGYNIADPARPLLSLNGVRYRSMQDFTADTGQMAHAVLLDWDVFNNPQPPPGDDKYADVEKVDITLRPDSKAVDAGVVLPGINDGFTGKAPDLGCYEVGKPLPHYGPRRAAQR